MGVSWDMLRGLRDSFYERKRECSFVTAINSDEAKDFWRAIRLRFHRSLEDVRDAAIRLDVEPSDIHHFLTLYGQRRLEGTVKIILHRKFTRIHMSLPIAGRI
jgi:hypothetical protein